MTGMIRHMILGLASASLIVSGALAQSPKAANRTAASAAATASPTPAAMLDRATGVGLVPLKTETREWLRFEPQYSYAYSRGTGSSKQVFLLLTAEPASDVAWRGPDGLPTLSMWAEAKRTAFVLVVFDDKGMPDSILETAGHGEYRSAARSVINDLPSLDVWFEINDGTRMSGHLTGGEGNCDGKYCEKRQNYYFDVTVVQ